MKKLRLLLIAPLLLMTLAFFTGRADAADCRRSAAGVYVCDARPEPPTFSGPGFLSGSLMFNRNYVWLEDHAPLYTEPSFNADIAVEGTVGILYYTVEGIVTDEAGNQWYKVADNEYAPSETIYHYEPSRLTGLEVNRQPERPFGWVMQRAQPSPAPDEPPAEDTEWLPRYMFVEIFDVALGAEGWLWMDIGDGRWIKQTNLALVDISPRPEEVGEDEFWVGVDLFEETFAAYEGDRMVYAGLTATGLEGWETNEGLFTVYARHHEWPMWGGDPGDDYYYLQDVPHTMFFDDDIALHGAYWHNDFGAPRSHGCVNMTPRDAEWVWYWSEDAPNEDLWVHVYSSPQDYFLQEYGNDLQTVSTPAIWNLSSGN